MNRKLLLLLLPGLSIPVGWAAAPATAPDPGSIRRSGVITLQSRFAKIPRRREPNAFNDFLDAAKAMVEIPIDTDPSLIRNFAPQVGQEKETELTTDEKAAMVEKNRKALDLLRRGLQKPYLETFPDEEGWPHY